MAVRNLSAAETLITYHFIHPRQTRQGAESVYPLLFPRFGMSLPQRSAPLAA